MRLKKRMLGILLSLVLVFGLMPWTSLTAYALETNLTMDDLVRALGSCEEGFSCHPDGDNNTYYILVEDGVVKFMVLTSSSIPTYYDAKNLTYDRIAGKYRIAFDGWNPTYDLVFDNANYIISFVQSDDESNTLTGKSDNPFEKSVTNYTVTYKVVNGTWDGTSTADKTETVASGGNPANVPTGMKANSGYTGGSWDTDPSTATISADTTFTYTFVADSSSSGDSSGDSSDNTNTNTDTSAKVPYDDVAISTGSVNDITGTAAATAESNPFKTKIENNDNLTTLLSLTDGEVAQGVNVWLDIQDMSASVPQTDKDLVQNVSTNLTVGMYLDINLFKKVGDNTAIKITETNGTVKASILIPESLWKSGRTFEIIRIHDGVATAIEGTYDENTHVFTFETDKFSTYALAYKDLALLSDSGTNSDSGSSNSSNSTQSTAPKTGDPSDIRVWYLLLLASLGGLGFLGLSKKKKVND